MKKKKAADAKIRPTPKSAPDEISKRAVRLVLFALAALTLGVFSQVRNFDFVEIDDLLYVTENANVTAGLTLRGIAWAFTTAHATNWHPLTWLSHMFDASLYGLKPGGHHLTSVWIHLANVWMLFGALMALIRPPPEAEALEASETLTRRSAVWSCAFVAALFAVHPLNAESVAWVAERKNVLSTFFWFLTLWAYARYASRPDVPGYLAVAGSMTLGLLAKPMLVTVPICLLLLDYWPLRRREPVRRLILEKIPLLCLSAASSIATVLAQKIGGAMAPLESMPLSIRLANAPVSCVTYIRRLFWPDDLAFFYPHPLDSIPDWQPIWAAAAIVAMSIWSVRSARRFPYVAVGWFWYLVTLIPVIGIVQVGRQAMADRYTYVPFVGLYVLLAFGASDLTSRWRNRRLVLSIAAAGSLAALCGAAYVEVGHWKTSIALYEQAVRHTRNNYIAHFNLANARFRDGQHDAALEHYREAVRIRPGYYPAAHFNLGFILSRRGALDEAIREYERVIEIQPEHRTAHNNLGKALVQKGRTDEAFTRFEEAIRIDPRNADAHNNIGNIYAMRNNLAGAEIHYRRALDIQPNSADAHFNLGNALARQNRFAEAEPHYQMAIDIQPGNTAARENLSKIRTILKKDGSLRQ